MGGEKELKRKRRISSGLELRRLTLLAFCRKCFLYSFFFKIPVCQRILSLVELKWFKLLVKLGLSFRSDAYEVFWNHWTESVSKRYIIAM